MTSKIKTLTALSAGLLAAVSMNAQVETFDLSAQRSESQIVNPVPGEKLDQKGLVINPVPHQISVDENSSLLLENGFQIKDRKKAFSDDLGFLPLAEEGYVLDIDYGAKKAVKRGVREISGAYELTIGKKVVSIYGDDEKGAFYGIQKLRQILESERAAA